MSKTKKLGNPVLLTAAANPETTKKVIKTASSAAKAITVVGVVFGLFVGYKVYRFFYPNTGAEAEFLAEQQTDLNNITIDFNLQTVAESLTHYLGTKYPSWDPRHWTEDDTKVADLIIATKDNFTKIAQLYSILVQRNLRNDLIQMLDETELDRVRRYINL